jgi:phenylacetate-CoA ligase
MTYVDLAARLRSAGVEIDLLAANRSHLPILFVYGRSDLTISFYGANIYPVEISEIIQGRKDLNHQIHSFQLAYHENSRIDARLKITLELMPDLPIDRLSIDLLRDCFWQGLANRNQDFREVTKMFDRRSIEIELQAYGTGVFSDRDPRIKHAYIAGK